MARADKGRPGKLAGFTPHFHNVEDSPAFRSLPPLAVCVYLQLARLVGVRGKHNGQVFLSVRQVSDRWGVGKDAASAAFYVLQARGFIKPTRIGSLGVTGEGRATTWALTWWGLQNGHAATRDFEGWSVGHDLPVKKGNPPRHKQKPVPVGRKPVPDHRTNVLEEVP